MTTDDGYILGLVRIDCFGVNQYSASKGPILVVPDLSQDATSAASYRDKPFILELAEAGYDVWVMNRRGTYPSRAHTSLDPNSAEFWDFTNTEVANYDITAAISHILAAREAASKDCEKVQIISTQVSAQETTIMLAHNPTAADKYVDRAVTIAPCHINAGLDLPPVRGGLDDRRQLRTMTSGRAYEHRLRALGGKFKPAKSPSSEKSEKSPSKDKSEKSPSPKKCD